MTQAGERYWRLHVELEALRAERGEGPEADAARERRDSLWESLAEKDRAEVRERLVIASGG